ncbi:MAG: hypothetical protein HQL22_01660 [Candidatus Omnitrophica bacterium]|nr:hypothetical protein [Candidatus Omnitrophota bacterium]
MIVEIFSLCDAATSDSGKLNLLGAFDVINVKQFPAVLAHCSVAVRLRFFASEQGDHHIEVRFIDADGKSILPPAGGSIKVELPQGQRSAAFNLVLNIPGLKIDAAGDYALELRVAGQGVISLPLEVRQQ